ncbi:hypothetical protein [Paenibacillus sp. EPM92]|uniref:hypothetical protein n=1 Tax=Paenibacillus sp. EPM92 TaxID=1561195 RepID=UPI001914F021|nr:hypothetical protein [Paenibacillus sp. EPM92]
MELIDKQKLLEWLDNKADARLYDGVYRALIEVFNEIKSGTFDDHSAQEEIPSWQEIAEIQEARAIQAEQERDARYEFDKQRTIRLEEERNALLEFIKSKGLEFNGTQN